MKRIIALFSIASLSFAFPRAEAQEASVEVFYNQLEPYGDWMDAGDYGYVWRPRDVDDSWRPYADGHWAYTDAGWTWLSDEPYSWAVYHYGRWFRIEGVGWAWAPGTEWAPAWVSFRFGRHHVGWAPLPPEASFGGESREIGPWSDSYYDVGPTDYVFVDIRDFGAPRLRDVELPMNQNVAFIDETNNVTNIREQNNAVFLGGPDFNEINRESAQKVSRLRLDRRTEGFGADPKSFQATVEGSSLRVAAPMIAASATTVAPTKIARKLPSVRVDHGWKDAGDPAGAQKFRAKLKAEAKVPAGLPPQPKFQRAALTSGGAATPGGKPVNGPAKTANIPATTVSGKTNAPGEKAMAVEKPLSADAAMPTEKDKKGKRNLAAPEPAASEPAAPATRSEIEPGKAKPQRPDAGIGSIPTSERTRPMKREEEVVPHESKPPSPIKPDERAPKVEAHPPKPEPQARQEEHAPKPEIKGKPEGPAAGDKGKKKDDKKDEKKPE